MSTRSWIDYLILPAEVSEFERQYLGRIHRIALAFFWAHVPVFMGVAWLAGTNPLQALGLTLLVLAGPTLAHFVLHPHPRTLSIIYGVTAMGMGGLLVHFGQGTVQIEMHFYFFVLLALLAVTSNPMAIVAAAATVTLHHAILFFALPRSVFNYDAELWVVGVHTAFVVIESIAACFVARSFFDNVVGLDKIVRQRTAELDARRQATQTVLDNVQEGLAMLDASGNAGERSAVFIRWFGEERAPFPELIGPHDRKFADWFRLAFDQVKEQILPLELAVDQLPYRLRMGERTLKATYQPVTNADGSLRQLLVILSDITLELSQARAIVEQREISHLFEHVGRDRQGVLDFLEEAGTIVDRLTYLPSSATQHAGMSDDLVLEARLLHTLKGNVSLFGLIGLAQLCHDLENRREERREFTSEDRALLRDAWDKLLSRLRVLFGDDYRNVVHVRRADLDDIVRVLRTGDEKGEAVAAMENWGLDPVVSRLDRLAEHARSIAERLDKPELQVAARGSDLRVDGTVWAPFWAALVHVVRNAVDHGIETPEVRVAAGKSGSGRVELDGFVEGDDFVVRVTDDGQGIDWPSVSERAAQRGLPHTTRTDLLNALLSDGFSTKDTVSDDSGRGVGMSAVRAEVVRRGGRISLQSEPSYGTTWEFRFPARDMRSASPALRDQRGAAA